MERPNTSVLAEQFMSVFTGMERAYGSYIVTSSREDGKQVGDTSSIKTHRAPVTAELWESHLTGKQGLGIIPIRDGNDCMFGAIDIDIYNLDHRALAVRLMRSKIPLVLCRTKSGGAHLYCFCRQAVPASMMRSKLAEIASFLGYGGSEVFPKQSTILADQGDVGQWINMPYFNGIRGMRYAVDTEGNAMTIDQFFAYVEHSRVEEKWFKELLIVADKDFEEGPPCLQALAQIGYPDGVRNDGLYNIGVYLKRAFPDGWEEQLDNYNHKYMTPALPLSDVQGVIKSLRKKEYQYGCTKQPIAMYCNAALCRTRKFGVGSGTTGRFPMLGGLTKLATKPPIWFWTVDGTRIEMVTADLQDPRTFQRKCMEYLNVMPQLPSNPVWQAAVQHAMDTVTIVEAPSDASPEGQFWEMVEKFCTSRAQALTMEEITLGKPFTDKGRTFFRMQDMLAYLASKKFFDFKSTKISSLLKDAGADHDFKVLKGRGVNYWSIKEFTRQSESFDLPKDQGEQNAF